MTKAKRCEEKEKNESNRVSTTSGADSEAGAAV